MATILSCSPAFTALSDEGCSSVGTGNDPELALDTASQMKGDLSRPATETISLVELMQALADPVRLEMVSALKGDSERRRGSFDLGPAKAA